MSLDTEREESIGSIVYKHRALGRVVEGAILFVAPFRTRSGRPTSFWCSRVHLQTKRGLYSLILRVTIFFQMNATPVRVVSATTITYTCILAASRYLSWPTTDPRTNLKAISSAHSILTTALGLTALLGVWTIDTDFTTPDTIVKSDVYLDDTQNHLIVGKSALGNNVTGIETGYLLYDNIALLLVVQRELQSSITGAFAHLVRKEPLLVVHHLGLLTAFGTLQVYVAKGRERGIWIIVALMLMRASDPVLHWRWWRRKRTGRPDARLDLLLAAVFAICRFGTLGWVLTAYGKHHNLRPWTAFMKQRVICKAGTATLSGLNAVWLATLVRNTTRRLLHNRSAR